MLSTLVIAIGTFPYALRAVEIPWSPDQYICVEDRSSSIPTVISADGGVERLDNPACIEQEND